MITAKEARALAEDYVDIETAVDLGIIEDNITSAAMNGEFEIRCNGTLTLICKHKLESKGYTIETGVQYYEPWYCIKW